MHDVIDTIEHELRNSLDCHAVIHMDPVQVGDEKTDRLRELVAGFLQEIDPSLSMHDFRIVSGPTHTNLIFDVAVPYRFPMTDTELISLIRQKVQQENPSYFVVIDIDQKLT